MHLFPPGNNAGHWRGSNDLLEITVGNWLRALPAEIDTGGTPAIPVRGTKYEKNPDVEDIGILFMVTRTGIEPMLPP